MKRKSKKNQKTSYKKYIVLILGICSVLTVLLFALNLIFVERNWYQDFDNDGFGDKKIAIKERFKPDGFVPNSEDTDDKNACLPIKGEQCKKTEPERKDAFKEVIKKLVIAENERDASTLQQIFVSKNVTYFLQKNITLQELMSYYSTVWSKTKKGENQLVSISKIQENQYEYITEFTWESTSGKTGVAIDTILVRFDAEKINSVTYRK